MITAATPTPVLVTAEDVAKYLEQIVTDYDHEHGTTDPDTGSREYGKAGREYVETLDDLIESIKARIPKPAATPTPPASGALLSDAIKRLKSDAALCEYVKEAVHYYGTDKDQLGSDIRLLLAAFTAAQERITVLGGDAASMDTKGAVYRWSYHPITGQPVALIGPDGKAAMLATDQDEFVHLVFCDEAMSGKIVGAMNAIPTLRAATRNLAEKAAYILRSYVLVQKCELRHPCPENMVACTELQHAIDAAMSASPAREGGAT